MALLGGSQHEAMRFACRVHFSAAAEQQRSASPLLMPCTPQTGPQHAHMTPCNGPASTAPQPSTATPSLPGMCTSPYPRVCFAMSQRYVPFVACVSLEQHAQLTPCNGPASAAPQQSAATPSLPGMCNTLYPRSMLCPCTTATCIACFQSQAACPLMCTADSGPETECFTQQVQETRVLWLLHVGKMC